MSNETRVTGLSDILKAMQELPAKVEGNMTRGGLRAGLRVMEKKAQAAVPVHEGKLKKSIRITQAKGKRGDGTVRLQLVAGGKGAYHSHLVEFGTASHYTGNGKTVGRPYEIKAKYGKSLFFGGMMRKTVTHPGIQAQPFMRPALDSSPQESLEAVRDYMEKRLPKELKKNGN